MLQPHQNKQLSLLFDQQCSKARCHTQEQDGKIKNVNLQIIPSMEVWRPGYNRQKGGRKGASLAVSCRTQNSLKIHVLNKKKNNHENRTTRPTSSKENKMAMRADAERASAPPPSLKYGANCLISSA